MSNVSGTNASHTVDTAIILLLENLQLNSNFTTAVSACFYLQLLSFTSLQSLLIVQSRTVQFMFPHTFDSTFVLSYFCTIF